MKFLDLTNALRPLLDKEGISIVAASSEDGITQDYVLRKGDKEVQITIDDADLAKSATAKAAAASFMQAIEMEFAS